MHNKMRHVKSRAWMDNKKEMSGMGRASIWGVIICAPNSWVNSPQETFNFAAELTASPVGGGTTGPTAKLNVSCGLSPQESGVFKKKNRGPMLNRKHFSSNLSFSGLVARQFEGWSPVAETMLHRHTLATNSRPLTA